ncbi:hypothetical protein D3C73_901360 [compost metagenome]
MKLTVFFNGQYWVGVVESQVGSSLRACQFLFGAEPKDGEILEFVHYKMLDLLASSQQQVEICPNTAKRINPKRLARQVAKEIQMRGVSTAAQEAMRLELETRKKEKKILNKTMLEEMKEYKYQLKQQKAKEKHRGR